MLPRGNKRPPTRCEHHREPKNCQTCISSSLQKHQPAISGTDDFLSDYIKDDFLEHFSAAAAAATSPVQSKDNFTHSSNSKPQPFSSEEIIKTPSITDCVRRTPSLILPLCKAPSNRPGQGIRTAAPKHLPARSESTTPITFVNLTMQSVEDEIKRNELSTKRKRMRTSNEQLETLQTAFQQNPMPNAASRALLSKKLGMTSRSVQIWFQNKRAKTKQDSHRSSSVDSSLVLLDYHPPKQHPVSSVPLRTPAASPKSVPFPKRRTCPNSSMCDDPSLKGDSSKSDQLFFLPNDQQLYFGSDSIYADSNQTRSLPSKEVDLYLSDTNASNEHQRSLSSFLSQRSSSICSMVPGASLIGSSVDSDEHCEFLAQEALFGSLLGDSDTTTSIDSFLEGNESAGGVFQKRRSVSIAY